MFLQQAIVFIAFLLLSPIARADVQTISLRAGWNLISFAVAPSDPAPSAVLAPLIGTGTFQAIWTYDAATKTWSTYPAPIGGIPEIAAIHPARGYWLKVTGATTLPVTGAEGAVPAATINLVGGWNLLGPVADEPKPYDRVFYTLPVREIWQYDALAKMFRGVLLPPVGAPTREDFTKLNPGSGYWVFLATTAALQPVLGTAAPGDIDLDPLLPDPVPGVPTPWTSVTPGDEDIGMDGFYDRPETQHAITLRDNLDSQYISIFNDGTGILSYAVSVTDPDSVPWLHFRVVDEETGKSLPEERVTGSVTTETAQVELIADRTGLLPGEYVGEITIQSNGAADADPVRTMTVHMNVAKLDGDYRLLAKIDTVNGQKADLHNPRLFLSLYHDRDGLKAIIDDSRTLIIPRRLHLSGDSYEDGTNRFTLSGSFDLETGNADNPYQVPLRRDITLLGDRGAFGDVGVGPLDLKGEYRETIRNVLGEPIYLAGTFAATRLSAQPTTRDGVSAGTTGGALPDLSSLTSTIDIVDRLLLTEVDIKINLIHTRPADLRLWLESPAGTRLLLRDQSTAIVGEILYDDVVASVDDLAAFNGELSAGQWKLIVEDLVSGETGQLVSWGLELKGTAVHRVEGTVANVGAGASVLLTGCGYSLIANTETGGNYAFNDLVNCIYQVTVHQNGFESQSINVTVNGGDSLANDLAPATTDPIEPIFPTTPTDGQYTLHQINTLASAGLRERAPGGIQLGGEDAIDSATFDIDRPPFDADAPGTEDSNAFLETLSVLTGSNAFGLNGRLDSPVGTNSRRIRVSIGQPIAGRSVSGNQVLWIGGNL